jgi:colicin import membrane protein
MKSLTIAVAALACTVFVSAHADDAASSPDGSYAPKTPPYTYSATIAQTIRQNIAVLKLPLDNPAAEVLVQVAPSGVIVHARLLKPSGSQDWDDAVVRAVYRTAKLPLDANGQVPGQIVLVFRPH